MRRHRRLLKLRASRSSVRSLHISSPDVPVVLGARVRARPQRDAHAAQVRQASNFRNSLRLCPLFSHPRGGVARARRLTS
eukprot:scaffold128199_cov63-Phaeocystis_antarctica.AAC.2